MTIFIFNLVILNQTPCVCVKVVNFLAITSGMWMVVHIFTIESEYIDVTLEVCLALIILSAVILLILLRYVNFNQLVESGELANITVENIWKKA